MADLKISQLPEDTYEQLNDDDVMPIVNQLAGETRKISLSELDKRWRALPSGGTINQVLAKLSNVDGAVQWLTLTKAQFGLGNVNNTADIDKPLSQAMVQALNDKATNTTVAQKANKTYVDDQLATKQDMLPDGVDGQVLTLVAGVESWVDVPDSIALIKYFGSPTANGSWRQRVDGTLFLTEVRKAGGWVIVSQFNSDDV